MVSRERERERTTWPLPAVSIACLLILFAASAGPVFGDTTIYQTDFSSDPGWITDRPSDYYWDSTNEAYNLTVRNETPAGQPANYFYKLLPHSVPSFTLTWDQEVTQQQWPCNVQFGLSDSGLGHLDSGQFFKSLWGGSGPGNNIMGCYAHGASGVSYDEGPKNAWVLNQWYTCMITYDAGTQTASYSVKEQGASTYICDFTLDVPGGITHDLVYLGTSNDFGGYYGSSVDQGLIDNVSLTPEPATLSLLALGGLALLRRKRGYGG